MADFLDTKKEEIGSRLNELKPLVEEYRRLEAAYEALTSVDRSNGTARRGRPPGSKTKTRGRKRGAARAPQARRSGNTRANQALELVRKKPGITIPEMADTMKIKQNYLYRVLPTLEAEGVVAKQGRGWQPRG